jgi:hypothetical protein
MIRRLFLHAGLPKTGSTSMQKWFLENRAALLDLGCTYPNDPPLHNYKQGYTVQSLMRPPGLMPIRQALTGATTPDVLFSNEGISNHFHDFNMDTLAQFRELTDGIEVHVVLFRRDPDRWLRSYHRQAVLNPRNNASDLWGTSQSAEEIRDNIRIKRLVQHDRLAQEMTKGFGATTGHLLNFDDPGAFVQFLTLMGLQELASIPLPRINEAVPDWAIAMMQRINAREPNNPERQAWKGLLFHFLDSNHTVLRDDARRLGPKDLARLNVDLLADMPPEVPVGDIATFLHTRFPILLGKEIS